MNFNFDITNDMIKLIDKKSDALRNEIINAPNNEYKNVKKIYVSLNGSDDNDGLTPNTAWRSIAKLNNERLGYGTVVCFERGGLWRGKIIGQVGVTYTSYGEGEKPKIYGSPEDGANPNKWFLVNQEKRIWKYATDMEDVGCIVFNHGEKNGIKALPDFVDGKFYVRTGDTPTLEEPFDYNKHLTKNFEFFSDYEEMYAKNGDTLGIAEKGVPLYLKCDDGNPGEIFDSIEFCTRSNIFSTITNNNITFDNLCLKYSGGMAVGGYHSMGIKVINCEIGWIGGAIQFYKKSGTAVRYGNGVEIAANCFNFTVEHNWVYQNYDAGISYQAGETPIEVVTNGVVFANNLIEYCTYGIEYFIGANDNPEIRNYQANIDFSNNIIRYSGFGFGNQRPNKSSSAAIKTWPSHANDAENFIIKNNILDRSRYCLIYACAHNKDWIPKYENNIFVQHVGTLGDCGMYIVNDEMVKVATDKLDDEELTPYIQLFDSDIFLTTKDWLYDLPEE